MRHHRFATFLGRCGILIVGVILGFVVLELLLTLGGHAYTWGTRQKEETMSDGVYKIVAIGESTTARMDGPAWPELLEQELNTRAGKTAFRVYNLGVPSTNTSMIVDRLPQDLARFEPDMVVSMMGVNDMKYFALPPPRGGVWANLMRLRVVKFFTILLWMAQNNEEKKFVTKALSCTGADPLGETRWSQEYLPAYESLLSRIYPAGFNGQYETKKEDKEAASILISFLDAYPLSYSGYELIVAQFVERSDWKNVLAWAKTMERMSPYIQLCVRSSSVGDAREAQLRHLQDIEKEIRSLRDIAQESLQRTEPAPTYYEQIRHILGVPTRIQNIDTRKNYQTLARVLAQHEIRYVAMQYPLLPPVDIQRLLEGAPQVVFVSNEGNFQEALNHHSYDEIFSDNFAGIFGHTTTLGSQLIASRAADVIFKKGE